MPKYRINDTLNFSFSILDSRENKIKRKTCCCFERHFYTVYTIAPLDKRNEINKKRKKTEEGGGDKRAREQQQQQQPKKTPRNEWVAQQIT
jgi:hypothetical protein